MNFASDNTGPAHPKVMEALARANEGPAAPYGADPVSAAAEQAIRDLFEAPQAVVCFVATGTAANALALSCMVPPYGSVFCARTAHIEEDECGAPEFYSGGAKLTLVDGPEGKIDPGALCDAVQEARRRGIHGAQPTALSLTQLTEKGTAYSIEEITALTALAREMGLAVHLDGARFANGCAALGCSAAEMSWKAGIDAVSFGGTKNGCLGVEAVVFFDPAKAAEIELRRKRAGHLWSKHRYLAAQMLAYATDDLWLEMAAMANRAGQRLARAVRDVPGAGLVHSPAGNMVFADLPRAAHARARAAGVAYSLSPPDDLTGPGEECLRCRLVCDWSKTEAEIDRLREVWLG